MSGPTIHRTARQLYRDCLRLIHHIAPGMFTNRKALALRTMVRTEFRKNQHLTDTDAIEHAKAQAVRALSNYFVLKAVPQDPKVQAAATDYHVRSVQSSSAEQQATSDLASTAK